MLCGGGLIWAAVAGWGGFAVATSQSEEGLSHRERLRIDVQDICPMSGEKLDREQPLKQWTDPESKERFYVCCEACLDAKPDPSNLDSIRKNRIAAQPKCLVMDNEVTVDSESRVLEGYRVYVCCPPCFKKIEKSAEKHWSKLDAMHVEYLKERK